MGWRFSAVLAVLMFICAFFQGFAGNFAAMIAACCASAGWGVASLEERKSDALAQLSEGK